MSRKWSMALVGANGTVGRQIIEILEEREFRSARSDTCPAAASERSWNSRGNRWWWKG